MSISITDNDTVDIVGLDNINADLTLGLTQPFKVETDSSLDLKPVTTTSTVKADTASSVTADIKPLKTDSNVLVDLKPAVLDLCLTANVGKIPSLCVRQPYRHSVSFSLYGINIWAFSFSGEQETFVEERHKPAQVFGERQPAKMTPQLAGGGLRIRLGD